MLSTVALRSCLLESNTVLNVTNSAEYEVWGHVNNCKSEDFMVAAALL